MLVDKLNRKRPISVHITLVFIGLFVALAAVVGWYNHLKTSELLTLSAQRSVAEISANVSLNLKAAYQPVESSVQILSRSGIKDAGNLAERLQYLPLIAEAATLQGQVSAFQVGYDNGDYFIVRYLKSPASRKHYSVSPSTQFVVDNVERKGDSGQRKRLFFSAELKLTGEEAVVHSDYDPRVRPWFQSATEKVSISDPYLFYLSSIIGFTVSQAANNNTVVIAADVTLNNMSQVLAESIKYSSTELVLTDSQGQVIAYNVPTNLVMEEHGQNRIKYLQDIGSPILSELYVTGELDDQTIDLSFAGKRWLGKAEWLSIGQTRLLLTAVFVEDEIVKDAYAISLQVQMISLLFILFSLPLVWIVAHRISVPIQRLAYEAQAIARFDFSIRPQVKSTIKEIDELAHSMNMMQRTIGLYNEMISSLSGEKDFKKLLLLVAKSTRKISQVDIAAIFLMSDEKHILNFELAEIDDGDNVQIITQDLPAMAITGDEAIPQVAEAVALKKVTHFVLTRDRIPEPAVDLLEQLVGHIQISITCVPLIDRNQEVTGILLLGDSNKIARDVYSDSWFGFIHELSGFAALSIENRQLIQMQKDLMESFIKLIANAIDAKSPYTGGHCQRVPILTKLLAQAACDDNNGAYKDFDLSDDQWEELHLACWLHDCGKVTTPEYVVDKATKLETIYDRIHEVRMRFEVLKRDAEIEYWRDLNKGGQPEQLELKLTQTLATLDSDFEFIAECNVGAEFMREDKVERLQKISKLTWRRTLSDRLGISWEETQRKQHLTEEILPSEEPLLADKAEHIIERTDTELIPDNNAWGFSMCTPEYKYNRGELYNLSISRGTLTTEERYKINEHMTQTIMMLEQLPYPKHLQNIPTIAGGHHESMDGKGYPKGLKKDDMPLTARMMAIADIFEALTAADRPYKKAKKLSEAIRIMGSMCRRQHIDNELFKLFLCSGVYLDYAQRFLDPDQIDEVDITPYITEQQALPT